MFMFEMGVTAQDQLDVGISSMVFNLMENETSKFEKSGQAYSWQKYSKSAKFCLLLQMQFSPKLGALVKWLGIICVGRP